MTFDKILAKGLRPDIVIRKLQYEFLDIGGEFFFKLKHNFIIEAIFDNRLEVDHVSHS